MSHNSNRIPILKAPEGTPTKFWSSLASSRRLDGGEGEGGGGRREGGGKGRGREGKGGGAEVSCDACE